MEIKNTPWPHAIIDDHIPEDIFQEIKQELLDGRPEKNTRFYCLNKQTNSTLEQSFPKLHSWSLTTTEQYESYLEEFEMHRNYNKKLIPMWVVIYLVDEENFDLHVESPEKVLSIVHYIAPEEATGTIIHDENKEYVTTIEWKENRSLVFCGLDNITWHWYKNSKNSTRIIVFCGLLNPEAEIKRRIRCKELGNYENIHELIKDCELQ